MSALENIRTTQQHVEQLLRKHPHLRDDHEKLTANFWNAELVKMGKAPKTISAYHMLELFAQGKLTSEETIQRARRKVQEENVELRGKKYDKRMSEEKDVRKHINQ